MAQEMIVVHGLKEINEELNRLGKEGQRAVRRGLRFGAGLIRNAMVTGAPRSEATVIRKSRREKFAAINKKKKNASIHMADNMLVAIKETPQGFSARIGPRGLFFYARFPEFGTQPHHVGRKSDRSVIGGRHGRGWWRYRGVTHTLAERQTGRMHPGSKATPFAGPAFDQKAPEALEALVAEVRKVLPQ